MADDPYTRVYWRLSDEYPDVWDDAATLGAYVQLLCQADMAWPSKPHRPSLIDDDAYTRLVDCGLVIEEGKRYTVRGLDKHRRARRRSARKGARKRWEDADADADADALASVIADANAYAVGMPSRAEPSRAEPRKAKTRRDARVKTRGKTGLKPLSDMLGGAT